jgi:hypothetical protein
MWPPFDEVTPMPGPSRFACIVGAPRCGTTTLAGFLQDHPEVCFSSVKEPHFFSQHDVTGLPAEALRRVVDERYLTRFFPHRSADDEMLAEASISYLYAAEQMAPILRLWPDARFVIAVRDPLEMLPSVHRRLLYTGDETVTDFHRAWALGPERAQGHAIPASCIDPRWLQYGEVARLGAYLERFMQVVGRERCHVVVFDDLASDPAAVCRRLLAFLDLTPQERQDFAPRRESLAVRHGWLQRLLKRPPIATRALLAGEKFRERVRPLKRQRADAALVRAIFAGRKKLLAWNRYAPPPAQVSPPLRREICEHLAGDVWRLSRLIDRDLSHWLDGRALALPARASSAVDVDAGRVRRPQAIPVDA